MANASAQAVDPAGALDLSDPKSTKFLANDTAVKYTAIKDAQVVQKKGANKVVVTWAESDGSSPVSMMSYNLKKEEKEATRDPYVQIVAQPLSLLMVREDGADIFKLNQMNMNPKNQSCEAPDGVKIVDVTYDIQSAGVLLAISSDRSKLLVFEAKGKGDSFACKFRQSFDAPHGEKIQKILPVNGILYVQFVNRNFLSITKYQQKNVLKSLQTSEFLEPHNFYELQQEPIVEVEVLGESIVLQNKDGDRLIFVNAMASKDSKGAPADGKDSAAKGKKGDSMFSGEMLTYLMFPASLGVVYYYQVYIKGNPIFSGSSDKPSEQ